MTTMISLNKSRQAFVSAEVTLCMAQERMRNPVHSRVNEWSKYQNSMFLLKPRKKEKKKDKYRPTPEISLQFCITCCLSTECRTKPGEIWIHMCICVIFPNSSFSWPVILSPCLVFQYFYDDWFYFILLWLYMPSKPHFLRK